MERDIEFAQNSRQCCIILMKHESLEKQTSKPSKISKTGLQGDALSILTVSGDKCLSSELNTITLKESRSLLSHPQQSKEFSLKHPSPVSAKNLGAE